jgi:hypothetical protein
MKFKQNHIILIVLFILNSYSVFSNTIDSIKVEGKLLIMKSQFVRGNVYQFSTKKNIKSFKIENGMFSIKLPVSVEPGVYRVFYEEEKSEPYTDIIIDGKEQLISLELKYLGNGSYPNFIVSVENKKWYDYLNDTNSRLERLTHLFDYLANFSGHPSGKQIQKIYQKERHKYYQLFNDFISDNDTTWAGLLVANTPYYFSDLNKQPVIRDFIRLNFYWEDIDTSNPNLINTPVFVEHIATYLNRVIEQANKHNSGFKEYDFKKAIDVVIDRFSRTDITKRYAIECLEEYFKKSDRVYGMLDYVLLKEKQVDK